MKTMLIRVFALCVSFTLSSCASQKTTMDYQVGYEFSSLKKYFLMIAKEDIQGNPKVSELDLKRIEKSLKDTLSGRYEQVEKNDADFIVRYHQIVEEKSDVKSYEAGFSHRHNWYHYGLEHDNVRTVHYQVGSILVDFLDAKTEEVIWRGVTKSRLRSNLTPQQKQQKIAEEITVLLQLFPPKELK